MGESGGMEWGSGDLSGGMSESGCDNGGGRDSGAVGREFGGMGSGWGCGVWVPCGVTGHGTCFAGLGGVSGNPAFPGPCVAT